jgi:heme oxygenase
VDIERLRQATAVDHETVETTVPLMSADLTRVEYCVALDRFYGIIRAWDELAAAQAPSSLRGVLVDRRRSDLIASDLAFFGAPPPAGPLPVLPSPATEAHFYGYMYVIEGSTLGGQYIARHVEQTLGLEPGMGDAYFRGYGEQTGKRWREFKAVLATVPEEATVDVIEGAHQMFLYFGNWMKASSSNLNIAEAIPK